MNNIDFTYFAILNFTLNFSVILLTSVLLRQKLKWLSIFCSSLICTAFQVALPLLAISNLLLIVYKMLITFLMCFIAIDKLSFKKFVVFYLSSLTFNFLLSGCLNQFASLFNFSNIYVQLVVLGILFLLYIALLFSLISYFYKKRKIENFIFKVNLLANNKQVKFSVLLDTGNILVDENTNLPVLIIDYSVFKKLFKFSAINALTQNLNKDVDGYYIKQISVGTSGNMFVFKPQLVEICDGKKKISIDVVVGLNLKSFSKSSNFNGLLSPLVLN